VSPEIRARKGMQALINVVGCDVKFKRWKGVEIERRRSVLEKRYSLHWYEPY
jgi:hypothetical protein